MAVKTRPEARSPGRRGQGLPVSRERRLPLLHMSESTSDGRDPPGSKGPDAEPYSPPSRLAELNKGAAEDLRNLGFDSLRHREVSATDPADLRYLVRSSLRSTPHMLARRRWLTPVAR